jgi:putative SOS response-associated peptidase YedK
VIPGGVRIFVCTAPVDLRHGFDRLAQTARERVGTDPMSGGALFVFANKRATRLKVLWFEKNGFCLLYKRKVQVKGEFVDAATILTTTPRGVAAEVHDRMPVILPPEHRAKWLDPSSRYLDLLEPDAATLELVPVSAAVNSVKNDGPECTERSANVASRTSV